MNGRNALFIMILLIVTLMGLSFQNYGYEATWRLWKIPTLMPSFIDLRHLVGSAESFQAGFNPIEHNPGDPLGRLFNLPFAWYLFFYTGIEQDDAVWIGGLLATGFLFCAWAFPGRLAVPAAFLMVLVLFSPASMLAVERGNVDLFIFVLCALMLIVLDHHTAPAAVILIVAAFLKLFPIFGLVVFVRESRERFLKIALFSFAVLLLYAAMTYANISASFAYTETGSELSYGVNVLPLYVGQTWQSEDLFNLLTPLFSLLGLGLFLMVFFRGGKADLLPAHEERNLSAFRLGAMIYAGTFLIGNNWDYRLIFLIFSVPQLVEWAMDSPARRPARWTLVCLVTACWYLVYTAVFGILPLGKPIAFLLDQASKWVVFAGLVYLFFASAPEWLKQETRRAFVFRRNSPA